MSLQEMRHKSGFSQGGLSKITGVPTQTIQHYESGHRNINTAKLNTLSDLCIGLNCSIEDILTDEELKEKLRKVDIISKARRNAADE